MGGLKQPKKTHLISNQHDHIGGNVMENRRNCRFSNHHRQTTLIAKDINNHQLSELFWNTNDWRPRRERHQLLATVIFSGRVRDPSQLPLVNLLLSLLYIILLSLWLSRWLSCSCSPWASWTLLLSLLCSPLLLSLVSCCLLLLV